MVRTSKTSVNRTRQKLAVIRSNTLLMGVALFEYAFQVPANRIGYVENGGPFTLMQLKVLQEVITLTVFTVIALFMFQGEKLQWNHLAAFGCLILAVWFVFMPTGK